MERPEIKRMRMKVLSRMLMLAILAIFTAISALNRFNIVRVDSKGIFGTAMLVSALAAVVLLAIDRTSYLPFLGDCVFPTGLLQAQTPKDATFMVNVKVDPDATHVVYWAAESGMGLVPDPVNAYGSFKNAGVVKTSSSGTAVLPVQCPAQYQIPGGRTLPRHVHYRALYKSGIAGEVKTEKVVCL